MADEGRAYARRLHRLLALYARDLLRDHDEVRRALGARFSLDALAASVRAKSAEPAAQAVVSRDTCLGPPLSP